MMRAGWRIGINSLSARWGRSILLVLAVSMATAFVVTVSTALDSLNASLRRTTENMLGSADLYVRHETGGRIDEAIIETVRHWPEVQLACPRLVSVVGVVNERNDKKALVDGVGIDLALEPEMRSMHLYDGRLAQSDGELVVDSRVADLLEAKVGDVLRVGDWGLDRELTVVGIHGRMNLAVLQNPEIRISLPVLQEIARYPGRITSIDIDLTKANTPEAVLEQRSGDFESPIQLVPSDLARAGLDKNLRASRILQYVAVMLATIAGAFIVLTGMTTAVSQRIGELAMLRCIGGSRSVVFVSQLVSGLVLGVLGGLAGLPLGLGLSALVFQFYGRFLQTGLTIRPMALGLALGSAVLAGLLGAVFPAFVSSRVSPLQALTTRARPVNVRGVLALTAFGIAAIVAQRLIVLLPSNEQVSFWGHIVVGVPLMVSGFYCLSVGSLIVVTQIAAPALGAVLRLPRGMLAGSMFATPYRHGFTSGALMLGLAMMIGIRGGGQSILSNWIEPIRFPDAFITLTSGVPVEHQEWIEQQDWVGAVSPIGLFRTDVIDRHLFGVKGIAPQKVHFISFEPEPFFELTNLEWIQGDEETAARRLAEGNAILVAKEFLTARGIGIGETLKLGVGSNVAEFEVVGVVTSPGLDIATNFFGIEGQFHEQAISSVFGPRSEAARVFNHEAVRLFQFEVTDTSLTDDDIQKRLRTALGPVYFGSGRMIKERLRTIADQLMLISNAIAFATLLIAALGMANVVAANVAARQYEFGVMRSVGASRSVLARLLMGEAVLIAMGAWGTGIGLSVWDLWTAKHLTRILVGMETPIVVPTQWVIMGCATVVVFALGAAIPTIMRLNRLKPVDLLGESPE